MYKFYEGNEYGLPNNEMIQSLLGENYFHNMEVEFLTEDGYFQMLTYDYIEMGKGSKKEPKCFEGVISSFFLLFK